MDRTGGSSLVRATPMVRNTKDIQGKNMGMGLMDPRGPMANQPMNWPMQQIGYDNGRWIPPFMIDNVGGFTMAGADFAACAGSTGAFLPANPLPTQEPTIARE